MQLVEIEQLLDRNMYGDLSSSRNGLHKKSNQTDSQSKDLYEVMVDLAIYIFVKLMSRKSSDAYNKSSVTAAPIVDQASDYSAHIISTFLRHVRNHETRS